MEFFKKYKIETLVFTIAVIARIIFFLVCLNVNGGNIENTVHGQDGYFEISRNLFLGNGFSINPEPPFNPYSYGVPGYPYFLFLLLFITGNYLAVGMIQLILGALIPVMGMYIARLLLPSHNRIPLFVGLLLALSPYQILFSFIFYTETLFEILFGLFLILFLKFLKEPLMRYAILAGIFLGLSTLTKATVQYVFLIAIVFSLWHFRHEIKKEIFLKLVCFFIVFSAILFPWLYRNYITFNSFSLSTQVPFNIYVGLLPSVLAIENETSFAFEHKKILDANPLNLEDADSLSLSKTYADKAVGEILKYPVSLVKLSLISFVTFFTHDGILTFLQATGIKPEVYLSKPALVLLVDSPGEFLKTMLPYLKTSMVFVLFARLFWIFLTILFFVGLYNLWRTRSFSPELIFSALIVFYFMFTTMINGLSVNARFRMPVEPVIFSVAFVAFSFYYNRIKRKLIS
mgnify:CR=1 FL=1